MLNNKSRRKCFSSTLLNFYYAIQGAVTRGKCAPSGVPVTNRWYRKRPGHTYINALMTRIILLEESITSSPIESINYPTTCTSQPTFHHRLNHKCNWN